MASSNSTNVAKNPYHSILDVVGKSEELAVMREKTRIEKQKGQCLAVLKACYKDWSPEDCPVDVYRVEKDVKVYMDLVRDRVVEDIQKKFRMATAVLREVAEKAPQFYFKAGKPEGIKSRRWKRDLPQPAAPTASSASKITSLLPMKVIQYIPATDQRTILRMLAADTEGIRFFDIAKALGYAKNRDKIQALRAYMNFLRAGNHVESDGKTKGLRYRPRPSLAAITEISSTSGS